MSEYRVPLVLGLAGLATLFGGYFVARADKAAGDAVFALGIALLVSGAVEHGLDRFHERKRRPVMLQTLRAIALRLEDIALAFAEASESRHVQAIRQEWSNHPSDEMTDGYSTPESPEGRFRPTSSVHT